jgi:hypothetical protein
MSFVVHMLICGALSKELSIARVTLELRLPMSLIVHMFICRALTKKLPIACVAFKSVPSGRVHSCAAQLLAGC